MRLLVWWMVNFPGIRLLLFKKDVSDAFRWLWVSKLWLPAGDLPTIKLATFFPLQDDSILSLPFLVGGRTRRRCFRLPTASTRSRFPLASAKSC